ncbi:hypothetical protein BH11PAT3_BH11PAT3_2930 [soil metagenome]
MGKQIKFTHNYHPKEKATSVTLPGWLFLFINYHCSKMLNTECSTFSTRLVCTIDMRNLTIAPGEHYHIFNRGVGKQVIFHDKKDYQRFLFLILHFQFSGAYNPLGRYVKEFVEHRVFNILSEKREIELAAFCLMSNHFHLIIKESEEGGISRYMQRVLNSYTKYFNAKYSKSGHLFQGPYKAVHIEDDKQLLHVSAYIHKNPSEWKDYEWSTYIDYVLENRWGKLLQTDLILDQFKDRKKYQEFVETSLAKELENELGSQTLEC